MEDLGSKPKLCVLNSVFVNGLNGRYRLRLADGRVYLEKRGCVESVG